MKNAHRNLALAAVAALTLTVAPSALADVRFHVSFPLPPFPPPPHVALRHVPLPTPIVDFGYARHDRGYQGRWNYENRYRDDRYVPNHYGRYGHDRVWVEGRWLVRPYPGAVWVNGYYNPYGYWVAGYWTRYR